MKPTKRKAFNFLRSYFDVLNELDKDSDKLNFLLAIINKQFLNEEPKDLNFISNLCYESQRHQIESSVKGWERASNETLGTTPPTPLGTTPPTTPKEEEEKEEEKGKEEEKQIGDKPPVFNFKKSLLNLGIEEEIISDWLKVRKAKRAANTKTAFTALVKQFELSGLSANDCIKQSVENSWSGFRADWLKNNFSKPQKQTSMPVSDYSKPITKEDNTF